MAGRVRFPEGNRSHANGAILVTEIAGGTLSVVEPDGIVTTVATLGGGLNGAAIGPDGFV